MIFHLFRRTPRDPSIASLYGAIVAQARVRAFYQCYGVPDSVNGRFELIVLDPPPFARGRTALAAALRGYKEINLRALRLLAPGGRLATFSCSHHVDPTTFEATCREAAADAGVRLRVLDTLPQATDHPVLLTVPETRYLKGLLLEAA